MCRHRKDVLSMSSLVPSSLVVIHEDFAHRMKRACDANEDIPAMNDGRLVWIKTKMEYNNEGVSLQTVMRWYYGAAMPRQKKLLILASKVLGVTPSWLSLGREDPGNFDSTTRRITVEGAVNALVGHMQMAGVPCAFPEIDDPRGDAVHYYSIIGGRQHPIMVATAHVERGGKNVIFQVPNKTSKSLVMVVLPVDQKSIEVWHVPSDLIDSESSRDGDMKTVKSVISGNMMTIGGKKIRSIDNFTQSILH